MILKNYVMVESLINWYGIELHLQPWNLTASCSNEHSRAQLACLAEYLQLAVGS